MRSNIGTYPQRRVGDVRPVRGATEFVAAGHPVTGPDEYANRIGVGRLNGIRAEPGTILGPDDAGQWYAVIRCDDAGVEVGFATVTEFDAAQDYTRDGGPRSTAEHRLALAARSRAAMIERAAAVLERAVGGAGRTPRHRVRRGAAVTIQ
jgi:hypothetical protein